jgi:bifunctional lysine-specific demethylase and histidyl-hydroxylase NO66
VTVTRPPSSAATLQAAAFTRCFDPISLDEFLADYWERQPLAVSRDEPGRFDDLLSPGELDRLLSSGGLRYPAFRLVKAGTQLDIPDYTVDIPWRPVPFAGTADVDRVVREYADGATIVLQALHLHHPPLARFSRALERVLGHPVQANAYSTPREAQGLGVHHDTHDVVCLQVAGEKRWLVYPPVFELPLPHQHYRAEMGDPGDPIIDLVLRPGDTLYLPRGWLHEARTSDTDSLHLTIGIKVYAWIDAVRAAVDDCASELEFRRSVPESGEPDGELLELLRDRLRPRAVAQRRREQLVRTRHPVREGQLAQLRRLDALDLDTAITPAETMLADLETEPELRLVFDGKEVVFPTHVRAEVEFVAAAESPFCGRDLPGGLDEEGRLVLLRRLVLEGFVRLDGPAL